jgi:hypothetical protein
MNEIRAFATSCWARLPESQLNTGVAVTVPPVVARKIVVGAV